MAQKVKTEGSTTGGKQGLRATPKVPRTTFTTSRVMDFFNEKELVTQTGHPRTEWPLVFVKEAIERAYRRAAAVAQLNEAIKEAHESATEEAAGLAIPKGLRVKVERHAKRHGVPWDIAVAAVAAKHLGIAVDRVEPTAPAAADAAAALGIDLPPQLAARAERLTKYTEDEFNAAVEQLMAEGGEVLGDDIERRLKRNRRKRGK
jgi:hypothetical protein